MDLLFVVNALWLPQRADDEFRGLDPRRVQAEVCNFRTCKSFAETELRVCNRLYPAVARR